ncbi:Encapsulating protein [Minicystis rosea]|nr:Encapsulating protein [Minicystis rosea]
MAVDLLRRSLAPILPEAWELIDAEAARVLVLNLAARKLVDFDGPHGLPFAAANDGRLAPLEKEPVPEVRVGRRLVHPLIELRTPIRLDRAELDGVGRGVEDPDLDPVVKAAERMAQVENRAIFNGYPAAGITGIIEATPHAPRVLDTPANYPRVIIDAIEVLRAAGVGGPYGLALGLRAYEDVFAAAEDGHPIVRRIERVVTGPIVRAPGVDGAVLLSLRGGDYELTVGQDLAIGYSYQEKLAIELYLIESFTFRVLEPAAAVYLKHA